MIGFHGLRGCVYERVSAWTGGGGQAVGWVSDCVRLLVKAVGD